MDIQVEVRGAISIITIRGRVDGLTSETLLEALQAQIRAGQNHLVADLDGVEYTSSAGLRALLATVKEVRRRGGDLRLAQVNPNVYKVLDLSGFTSILKIYAEVDLAIASFNGVATH